MDNVLSIGDAAGQLNVNPRVLTNMFYNGQLDRERCPVVGGRRLIPRDYLGEIKRVLHEARLRRLAAAEASHA
jgi:hypothetical protein